MTTHSKPSEIAKWYQNWRKEQVKQFYILERPSPTLKTTWYAEQVVKGNIKASKKNTQACQRHLNDLKRQGTEDFPWVFDEEMAHWPIRYIEKFWRPSKITKQFNIFVDNDEMSFVGVEILKRNEGEIDLEVLKGKECVGGYDLSQTEDFTSAYLEFLLDDGVCLSWVGGRYKSVGSTTYTRCAFLFCSSLTARY